MKLRTEVGDTVLCTYLLSYQEQHSLQNSQSHEITVLDSILFQVHELCRLTVQINTHVLHYSHILAFHNERK